MARTSHVHFCIQLSCSLTSYRLYAGRKIASALLDMDTIAQHLAKGELYSRFLCGWLPALEQTSDMHTPRVLLSCYLSSVMHMRHRASSRFLHARAAGMDGSTRERLDTLGCYFSGAAHYAEAPANFQLHPHAAYSSRKDVRYELFSLECVRIRFANAPRD